MFEGFEFYKLEGCGNNFVVAFKLSNSEEISVQAVRRLLDGNFGVGGDGLLLVEQPTAPNCASFKLDLRNPDGSPMQMCGNGIRCICRFLVLSEAVPPTQKQIEFDVDGRKVTCELFEEGRLVELNMGRASFEPKQIPAASAKPLIGAPLEVAGREFKIHVLSVGNPHCVIFLDDLNSIAAGEFGPLLERHPLFPKRVNVEFAQILAPDRIKVVVWERGAGLTLACGSGACATLVAGVNAGLSATQAQIELPGGNLFVRWDASKQEVYLKGPAREIFKGRLCPVWSEKC